ncbi:MAG: Glutathione S-transferase domain protein [Myxococcaceae bacterium]|jgi:glutathione S-transferase|nr:Glutathione S-transferase domain protein [Myxococcaceae bacterium]
MLAAMKLYYTPTSPFVRKVLVAAHELGLAGRIETVTLRPTPMKASPELSNVNPLSKIPAMVTDLGTTLFDSRVICEYLDTLHAGRKLVPESGPRRFDVLRTQALADGVLDASILVFYERAHRPENLHWDPWLDGQAEKARQGIDALAREVRALGNDVPDDSVDLAQIAVACTLGWLELRKPLGDLRPGRQELFAWYDRFRGRPSMKHTEPAI